MASSNIALSVEGLGKKYLIGHRATQTNYHSLRESLVRGTRSFVRKSLDMVRGRQIIQGDEVEEFWALRDVSFDVQSGDVIGVIGRNGAGKSTLLKVLSRITEPSAGRVEIRGSVASLLEVGTGFHPELSGRENIYLNGAILGMNKAEIRSKFDEIVAFAEVEKFLDTPVKRYSSGMYVRLAFSVAAHLEPDILLVDEVLAVGDLEFQKKSLGKLEKIGQEGRTVVFVSHQISFVRKLCNKGVLLDNGSVDFAGDIQSVCDRYTGKFKDWGTSSLADWQDRESNGTGSIIDATWLTDDGQPTTRITFGKPARLRVRARFNEPLKQLGFGLFVETDDSEHVLDIRSAHSEWYADVESGEAVIEVELPPLNLYPGGYLLSPWIFDHRSRVDVDWVKKGVSFEVIPNSEDHAGMELNRALGKYWVSSKWVVKQI